jgi:hypothetical protein
MAFPSTSNFSPSQRAVQSLLCVISGQTVWLIGALLRHEVDLCSSTFRPSGYQRPNSDLNDLSLKFGEKANSSGSGNVSVDRYQESTWLCL